MEKRVEFKVGEETLRGSLFAPQGKGPFPSVIFFHGSGGNCEAYFELAKIVSEYGILGFAFNYRGCGRSGGKFEDQTVGMGIEDSKAAISFLLGRKEVDKKRLGFVGGSFGGFMASLLTSQSMPKVLVLIAPAAYPLSIIDKQHRDSDDKNIGFEKSPSYRQISQFLGALLIVSCEIEDVLPAGMVDEYLEKAIKAVRKESYLLRGARHNISLTPKAKKVLKKKVLDWLLETL